MNNSSLLALATMISASASATSLRLNSYNCDDRIADGGYAATVDAVSREMFSVTVYKKSRRGTDELVSAELMLHGKVGKFGYYGCMEEGCGLAMIASSPNVKGEISVRLEF